jgi:hypothetical protein
MGSAVINLQKAILAGEPSLTQLLRLTKVVAAKLTLNKVQSWVDLELGGYPIALEPPDYRQVFTESLEVYNAHRGAWQFAGNLNFALKVRQPIAEIERFSREDRIAIPIAKNFPIKNDFDDSFGSDWAQQFIIAGSQYGLVVEAVTARWTEELGAWGIELFDIQRFMAALSALTDSTMP